MLIKILGVLGSLFISFFGAVVFNLSIKHLAILLMMAVYMFVLGYISGIKEATKPAIKLEENEENE